MSEASNDVDGAAERIRNARAEKAKRRQRAVRIAIVVASFAMTGVAVALVLKAPTSRDLGDIGPHEVRLALSLELLTHPVVISRLRDSAPPVDDPSGDPRSRWQALSEAERNDVRIAYQELRSLSRERQRDVRARYKAYRALPEGERRAIRGRFEAFSRLPPAERQALREAALAP